MRTTKSEPRLLPAARLLPTHKQLRALSIYLRYLREEECIRIAREVQDELGDALAGMKLELTWLASRLPPKHKQLHTTACSISRHMDETIDIVRRIAADLRPGLLDAAGLLPALEWQASEFQRRSGIRCRVTTDLPEAHWDQDLNTALFRIFQETLTNILRHANATRVKVRLFEAAGNLVLEVRDNGCGISKADIHNTRSIGLLGMREQAALLEGRVRWSGAPDKGTTVSVCIPHPSGPNNHNHHHENTHHR